MRRIVVYVVLASVFAAACALAGQFPAPWPYVFAAGLAIGGTIGISRRHRDGWRVPVVVCLAAGAITAPTAVEYPVKEILGLYLTAAMLIAVSARWWQLGPYRSVNEPHS